MKTINRKLWPSSYKIIVVPILTSCTYRMFKRLFSCTFWNLLLLLLGRQMNKLLPVILILDDLRCYHKKAAKCDTHPRPIVIINRDNVWERESEIIITENLLLDIHISPSGISSGLWSMTRSTLLAVKSGTLRIKHDINKTWNLTYSNVKPKSKPKWCDLLSRTHNQWHGHSLLHCACCTFCAQVQTVQKVKH